ncbi:MAG: FtsX-like permease family protein [Candidatus Heimdallarchaeaceae archaeon]
MIGQVKYSWINFRRSFTTSLTQYANLILSYILVGISINSISITKAIFEGNVSYRIQKSYLIFSIVSTILSLFLAIIVTRKTVRQIFNHQIKDIALMKNVGSKTKWIYSYILFYHILVGVISFVIGLFLSAIIFLIILYIFKMDSYGNQIKFLPAFLICGSIILLHYLVTHNEILRILNENNLEISSKGLKNYKSIFEFDELFKKIRPARKFGLKAFLRSGEIRSTFFFIFLISTASIIFLFSTINIGNTFIYSYTEQFGKYEYLIGKENVVNFFENNIGYSEYNYSDLFTEKSSLNSNFINSLKENNVVYDIIFLNKRKVSEINVTIPDSVNLEQYKTVGKERSLNITIIGYINETIFLDRLIEGVKPNKEKNEIVISQSVNKMLLDDYTLEFLQIGGLKERYRVTGIINENFANGYTIYIPMRKLRENLLTSNGNCILIKSVKSDIISKIYTSADESNYRVAEIKKIVEKKKKELWNVINLINSIYGILFIITLTRFLAFGILLVNENSDDIKLMYKIGIKKKILRNCMLNDMSLNTIPGFVLSFLLGLVIIKYFIVESTVTKLLGMKITLLCFTNFLITFLGIIIGVNEIIKKQ